MSRLFILGIKASIIYGYLNYIIPTFPVFNKLSLGLKDEIEDFTSKFPPYSDFNFTSLWSYDVEQDILVSKLNDNLVIRLRDYITNEPFYSFLGRTKTVETATILINLSKKYNISPELKLIPEITISSEKMIHSFFKVKEDRDNFDYVVSTEQLSQMKGLKFRKKNQLINKFYKDFPNGRVARLDKNDSKLQSKLIDLFHIWAKKRRKKEKDYGHELIALRRLLKNIRFFKLDITGVYHDRKLIGFLINEKIHSNYSIGHFIKTDPDYKGVTELLHKHNSLILTGEGYEYINFEQDLGLKGLKHAKELWRPVHFLKKYKISPKK